MRPIPHERGPSELSEGEQVQQFIKAVNQAMLSNRLSQRALSERIGIKIGTLTKYLRGEVHPMKVGVGIQARLAEALGVTLDALLAYYRYGEYITAVSLDDVESWIRSDAGQQDLPVLMARCRSQGGAGLVAPSKKTRSQHRSASGTSGRLRLCKRRGCRM